MINIKTEIILLRTQYTKNKKSWVQCMRVCAGSIRGIRPQLRKSILDYLQKIFHIIAAGYEQLKTGTEPNF